MNSLMPVRENIFDKIKNFFKNLFSRNIVEDYEIENSEDVVENQQQIKNSIFADNIKVEETEEQKLLKLQRLIREKRISEQDLSIEERNKLRNLYNLQIQNLKKSIMQNRNKILKLKYEQERKSHATGNMA